MTARAYCTIRRNISTVATAYALLVECVAPFAVTACWICYLDGLTRIVNIALLHIIEQYNKLIVISNAIAIVISNVVFFKKLAL